MPVYVDSWSPWLYGTPVDRTEHYQQFGLKQWAACYVIVSKNDSEGDGELFWNGTDFEVFDAANYASYAIAGTSPRPLHWDVTIPWSLIGSGHFIIRPCASITDAQPSPSNRIFTDGKPQYRHIVGPQTPNPEGVIVNSNFGGTDAMQVVDPSGNPIAGVTVKASVMLEDNNIVFERGDAVTGPEGRWALYPRLEPNREHRIDFEKDGYTFTRQIITTGSAT